MQFVIDRNNVNTQWLGRLFLAFGVLLTALIVGTSVLDRGLDSELAVTIAICVIGFCVIWPWSWRRSGTGTIELNNTGLRVHTKSGDFMYPWSDIVDIRTSSLSERGNLSRLAYQALGIDTKKQFALVRLNKWLKKNPVRERWGTSIAGLPLFVKQTAVFPQDLDGFLQTARQYWDAARQPPEHRQELL